MAGVQAALMERHGQLAPSAAKEGAGGGAETRSLEIGRSPTTGKRADKDA